MISIRQFAAAAVLGTAVIAGGCASDDRPGSVPLTARELGAGREVATFNATEEGTVYIVDDTRNDMIYTGRVKKGDNVRVDAKDNRVLVNGAAVTEQDLLNDHKYKIYFEEGPEAARSDRDVNATVDPDNAAQPAGTRIITSPDARTTVTTDPNAATAPPADRNTTITTDPNAKTTITTDPQPAPRSATPDATVTTPDGDQTTITTDPETGRTTIKQD